MKKILFTLLFCIVSLVGYSQTKFNETEHTNISITIDSLQNEYNFLNCEFKLYKVLNDFTNLSKDTDIKCNFIDIHRLHEMFYEPLYEVLADNYIASVDLQTTIEENYQSVKELIYIHYDNFSTTQKEVIDQYFNTINAANEKVNRALKVYKMSLDLYKNK